MMMWDTRLFFSPKRLLDGTTSGWCETLTRRWVRGVWQYRRPTREEELQLRADNAW